VTAALVTSAIVLRAIPYGEADRIVTMLGRTTGRVSALARGARKSLRRFGGGMGMAATGEATLRERAGAELMVLESFEISDARLGLGSDLSRTSHAAYAAELCDRLCAPRHAEPEVFHWLDRFLGLLEHQGGRAERLRAFELGLLARLGLGPSWQVCVACGRDDLGEEMVRLQPERGGVVCGRCGQRGALVPAPVRLTLHRFATMALEDADGLPVPRDLITACRSAVFELLGQHLSGPLKSVEFINKVSGV
jgi:DNA repair protein RecO (recombination protein O)